MALSLKEARKKDKIEQFIKEREDSPPADKELLEKLIESAAKTPKSGD